MSNPTIYVFSAANSGLTPSAFVPLIIPVNFVGYMLKNIGPDTVYFRSDPSDANTEDSMGAGFYEDLLIPVSGGTYQYRFVTGEVLYYAKCTGPLVGKFYY